MISASTLKPLMSGLVSRVVGNDFAWRVLSSTLLPMARAASVQRTLVEAKRPARLSPSRLQTMQRLFPDCTVKHGPFAGLRYPGFDAAGSALFPKLLGSYEAELAPTLERICATPYGTVVDVGCAEGYYAVGLARRLEAATVYAFDTDERALALCRRMAELNGVSERVKTGGFCSPQTLLELPLQGRALIVSDCEGYEKTLFTSEVARHLREHDLLIEVHDLVDITISSTLQDAFKDTHQIERVRSVDDIHKAQTYDHAELSGFDLNERKALLGEARPAIMEWFFLTPRES